VGNGAALGRMFALRLNRDRVVAEHVQMPFGIGLLEQFTALGRRRDWVETPASAIRVSVWYETS